MFCQTWNPSGLVLHNTAVSSHHVSLLDVASWPPAAEGINKRGIKKTWQEGTLSFGSRGKKSTANGNQLSKTETEIKMKRTECASSGLCLIILGTDQ